MLGFEKTRPKVLLYAEPFPMLTASPVGLTYLVGIITVAGVAVMLKQKEVSKAARVFYGIGLVLVCITFLVFFLVSFLLLFPSAMLPFER